MTTILVVDDSPIDRRLVQGLLEKVDEWKIVMAESTQQAFQILAETEIDAVVSDLQMPERDGLELVRTVVANWGWIPVILITSTSNEKLAFEALQAGAASYSPKSSLSEDLIVNLQSILSVAKEKVKKGRVLQRRVEYSMKFVLENDNSLIGPLVELLQHELQGWDEADKLRIGIALDESLVNGMYHGNLEVGSELRQTDESEYYKLIERRCHEPPYSKRRLTVEAEFTPDSVRVTVQDEGPGFDPSSIPDPTDPENLERVSGRGLLLIQTFMNEVTFNEKGNRISMFKQRGVRSKFDFDDEEPPPEE